MSSPFIGQIMAVGFNFAPRGWAFCNGQLLSIAQNTALFSLLGTTYGGNGQTTFGLPDLRSRVPIHFGQGVGLAPYVLGQVAGTENTTLTVPNLPAHNHSTTVTSNANTGTASDTIPTGNFLAADNQYKNSSNTTLNASAVTVAIGSTGNNQAFNNLQPYLALNFIIALQGIFPSRN